jgi:hypothetical protein
LKIFLDSGDKNISSEENNFDDNNEEMGGLFRLSQRKKININDQEDYTLNQQNEKPNWNFDEVCKEKKQKHFCQELIEEFSSRLVILFGIVL